MEEGKAAPDDIIDKVNGEEINEDVEFSYEETSKSAEYNKVYSSVNFDENWGGVIIYVTNINDEDIIVEISRAAILYKPKTMELLKKAKNSILYCLFFP